MAYLNGKRGFAPQLSDDEENEEVFPIYDEAARQELLRKHTLPGAPQQVCGAI